MTSNLAPKESVMSLTKKGILISAIVVIVAALAVSTTLLFTAGA